MKLSILFLKICAKVFRNWSSRDSTKRSPEDKAGRTYEDTGKLGERMAVEFLRSSGFRILQRNYRTPFGEIDVVAEKHGCLVFVEVKSRISERFGPPLAAITWRKQMHIIRNCLFYLKRHGMADSLWRIDVIGIKLLPGGTLERMEHIRNAIQMEAQGQGSWVKGQGRRRKYNGGF